MLSRIVYMFYQNNLVYCLNVVYTNCSINTTYSTRRFNLDCALGKLVYLLENIMANVTDLQ